MSWRYQRPVCTPRASRWRSRPNTSTRCTGSSASRRRPVRGSSPGRPPTVRADHRRGPTGRRVDDHRRRGGGLRLRSDLTALPGTVVPPGARPRRRARSAAGGVAVRPDRQADNGRPQRRPLSGRRGASGRCRRRGAPDWHVRPLARCSGQRPPAGGARRGVGRGLLRDPPRGRDQGGGRGAWVRRFDSVRPAPAGRTTDRRGDARRASVERPGDADADAAAASRDRDAGEAVQRSEVLTSGSRRRPTTDDADPNFHAAPAPTHAQ